MQVTLNELGVVHMKQGRLQEAHQCFSQAIGIVEIRTNVDGRHRGPLPGVHWPELYSNLGCACRKMCKFQDALHWYYRCLALDPDNSQTHAQLGFTMHLMGRCACHASYAYMLRNIWNPCSVHRHEAAIESYHKALALRPTDAFITDMLTRAFEDAIKSGSVSISLCQHNSYV
jgi:anaphase-promoting complex subunit 6